MVSMRLNKIEEHQQQHHQTITKRTESIFRNWHCEGYHLILPLYLEASMDNYVFKRASQGDYECANKLDNLMRI